MPIYNFEFDDDGNPLKLVDQQLDPKNAQGVEARPLINPLPLSQEAKTRDDIWFERQNVNVAQEFREILPQGYRTMDRGMKNYFSGIQVPTKDSIKMMQVRISGGDKPYLIWAQDLEKGRVTLPVMSITRQNDEDYPAKFSPAHFHYMSRRFLDAEGSKIALAFRPVPALINYQLSVWAEFKRDLEYILYQVRTRFNPVAEFLVEDEHLRGSVFLKYNGMTNSVDTDVPADQRANKRYDFAVTMEGWLPLPERVVPSILGRVTTLKESVNPLFDFGDVLDTAESKDIIPVIDSRSGNG